MIFHYIFIPVDFASVCQQSTDFHFPDLDTQLRVIQQHALRANAQRKQAERNSNDGGKLTWTLGRFCHEKYSNFEIDFELLLL